MTKSSSEESASEKEPEKVSEPEEGNYLSINFLEY